MWRTRYGLIAYRPIASVTLMILLLASGEPGGASSTDRGKWSNDSGCECAVCVFDRLPNYNSRSCPRTKTSNTGHWRLEYLWRQQLSSSSHRIHTSVVD